MRFHVRTWSALLPMLLGCSEDASESNTLPMGGAGNASSSARGGASDAGSSARGGAPGAGSSARGGAPGVAGKASASAGTPASMSGGASSSSSEPPSLADCSIFPADNPWNQDVSALPIHPNSERFIDSIGREAHIHPDFGTEWEGAPIGIPFVVVSGTQAPVPIQYEAYGDESDPGPFPIPRDAPIEGGPDADGDRHVIAVDADNCMLYELYRAFPVNGGAAWRADSGAVFDLSRNDEHPFTYTSADAAGLPIFPGLVRYDEVAAGELNHAVRFTVSRSQAALVAPARHYASSSHDENLPPMGLRVRMKASYDCSSYSTEAQVVCRGLKRFGMIVADNGSNWYISGAPDPRWDDDALGDLKRIPGSAFEVVDTGEIQTY